LLYILPISSTSAARRDGESVRMEVLDATSLAERLKWEAKEYWLHLEAETPLEKYPGKQKVIPK
jgi:hypothetical protein|tara:strand:+ start:8910 stop:9101 length:192 start_codon:yes stop_codon:yes gene_type:complete